MAAHVWILLEVTAVIVKQDILETTVKQVRTTSQDNSCSLGMFLSYVVNSLVHECIILRESSFNIAASLPLCDSPLSFCAVVSM